MPYPTVLDPAVNTFDANAVVKILFRDALPAEQAVGRLFPLPAQMETDSVAHRTYHPQKQGDIVFAQKLSGKTTESGYKSEEPEITTQFVSAHRHSGIRTLALIGFRSTG